MEFLEYQNKIEAYENKHLIGIISFNISKQLLVIDSTYVAPEYRGKKVAAALVEKAVCKAKKDSLRIQSFCSYATKELQGKKEYQEYLK